MRQLQHFKTNLLVLKKRKRRHVLSMHRRFQQVFMMGHEDGFQKALRQISIFSLEIDVKKFDVLKDVKI